MAIYHLDTSALVKRYIRELGTEAVNALYLQAERGEGELRIPIWNVGEFLGVVTERKRLGRLNTRQYTWAIESFGSETVRLHRLGVLRLSEMRTENIIETWPIIAADGLYEADALQLTLCALDQSILASADAELLKIARKRGFAVLDVSR